MSESEVKPVEIVDPLSGGSAILSVRTSGLDQRWIAIYYFSSDDHCDVSIEMTLQAWKKITQFVAMVEIAADVT